PRVDYAYYIEGLVDFERTPNLIEHLFRADLTQRPPSTARKAFAAFRKVVEQYPKSEYAHDSLQRMVYLRNRLASYEVHVARYYFKRGAYVAAAQRAKGAIEQYDGAPAVREVEYLGDGGAVEAARFDLIHRQVLLDERFQDRVEHLVGRQRVGVFLSRPKLRGRRALDHPLRNRAAEGVPVAREAVHQELAAVLDRREAAGHVAVERRIA